MSVPERSRGICFAAWMTAVIAGASSPDLLPCSTDALARMQAEWLAPADTPAAVPGPDGMEFPVIFSGGQTDRLYWDCRVPLDLSAVDLLAVDITCDQPGTIRSLNLYFESGDGWYVAPLALHTAGRQQIFVPCQSMETEGKPGGLAKITRVRLSPWRGADTKTRIVLHGFRPTAPIVAVLRGTGSLPDPAERRFGDSAARRVQSWIEAAGLPSLLIDEAAFRAESHVRVAILPYNDVLPDRVYTAVEAFVRNGGRLIVCYSSDARLARLLGVRLGEYQRLEGTDRWSGFRFLSPAALHLPERVGQQSQNIRAVLPDRPDAHVIATWEDDSGHAEAAPAWVQSDTGFWMTHVPSGDDTGGKQSMFTAFVARLYPPAWRWIAEPLLASAGRIDSFRDLDETCRAIETAVAAGHVSNAGRVSALLDRVRATHAEAAAASARGEWGPILDASQTIRNDLTEAYARIQHPQSGQIVGIWDHSGTGWSPGDWDRTCRLLRDHGVTHVFANMLWAAQAHYPSDVLPRSYTSRSLGDQVDACLRAAHANGLRLHVWKVCWNLEGIDDEALRRLKSDGALQTTDDGTVVPWLNPAIPENARRELESILEVARRYPVDGIHLDYIRYPGTTTDFGPASRAAFEQASGRHVDRWPGDVKNGGERAEEFKAWRASVITAFVRSCRRELNAVRPGIQLSAAVFANQPDCRLSVGQDWALWLREGLVDFVCPMNYDENLARFASRAAGHMALPGAAGRVIEGIGATSGESRLLADQVIEQVLAARKAGAAGFVLFDMSPTVRDHILPALRMGITAPSDTEAHRLAVPASVPVSPIHFPALPSAPQPGLSTLPTSPPPIPTPILQ